MAILAVVGGPVDLLDPSLVDALRGPDAAIPADAVTEVRRLQLIGDPVRAQLHPVVRERVYDELPILRRASLHRLAARWYENQGRAGRTVAPADRLAAAASPVQQGHPRLLDI